MKENHRKNLKAGVMGWPVSHSLSPVLHGYWLSRYNIKGSYEAIPVHPGELEKALSDLRKKFYRGVNLTVPHKESALGYVDKIDNVAKRIGAINTIIVEETGALVGSNTDAIGFKENLRDIVPEEVEYAWSGKPAVVLGAGGAARAVCVALMDIGIKEIRIVNRNADRAVELIAQVEGMAHLSSVYKWDKRADTLSDAGLLVNTTALGMTGKPTLNIDLTELPIDATVHDIVYTPQETDLLFNARQRGNKVVDGLGMLLHQARPGFYAWFGTDPIVTSELRQVVLANLSK